MDWRDKLIDELRRENAALRAIIAERDATIVKLTERIEELERRLNLNSNNSGKPPSSDGLKKQSRVQSLREKSDKKTGGQLGHKGSTLEQVDNPDSIKIHKNTQCPYCRTDLTDVPVDDVCKRQIFDIPKKLKPFVTEHQFEIKYCPGCCKKVATQKSETIKAPVQYGHKTKAVVSYLNVHNLIPEDRVSKIMNGLFCMPVSVSTIANIAKTCVANVEQVVEQVKECLKTAPVKGVDETSVRIAGKTCWVHTLCNDNFVHYRASEKRGDISKDLTGTVVHDHFKPYYFNLKNVNHSLCNAHHLRELKAVTEIDKEPWARNMTSLLLFGNQFAKDRQHSIPNNIPTQWLAKFKKLYDRIIEAGLSFHDKLGILNKPSRGKIKRRPGHNLLLRLRNFSSDVLRFLDDSNVPFTNNQAEQALRMIKVKQKISGCFRTFDGAKDFFAIRSYTATAQKQGYNILDALTYAFNGTPLLLTQT